LERRGTVVLLGAPDTGKTTLALGLVNAALAQGLEHVFFLDGDVGQGEVGPPATIALAAARDPVASLSELHAGRLAFVGATSPPGHLLAVVTGAKRLADEAVRRGAGLLVVDTSGLVSGSAGRQLKQAKIDLLQPSVILALQAGQELESLLRLLASGSQAEVIRLAPHPDARPKPPGLRRARRSARFFRHFSRARTFELPTSQVVISHGWLFNGRPLPPPLIRSAAAALQTEIIHAEDTDDGIRLLSRRQGAGGAADRSLEGFPGRRVLVTPAYVLQNLLVGLVEPDGSLAEIGILHGVDFQRRVLTVLTPLAHVSAIRQLRLGRLRLRPDGSEIGPVRPGDL
jgi:polynucleotide 5'-hydroxyl-kinase GRC3/NOL9